MDLHSSSHPSPPGFQTAMTLAMELENKLKSETEHSFDQLQQQTRICGNGSDNHIAINIRGENEAVEEVREEDDVEKHKVNSRLSKIFDGSISANKTSSDLKKDMLNNSDVLESELMEDEDDDDSLGRSSPGSYADLSPSVDNSKEGEDMEDDFDLSARKFGNPMVRGRLQDGSPQTFGVNGGRPGSSEGDYYDYNHIGGAESEGIGVENGNGDKFYPCHLCSFTAATKSHFNSHMNTHYNHKCNHCDYTSRTEGRLKRHMKDFHPELQSEGFSSSRVLKVDREGNHGDSNGNSQGKTKTYRCKQCSFSATVKAIFWEHTKGHIKVEKLLTCPKCPFVTEYKHHLEYHLRNHFGSKPFKCPKCNYSCVNKSMLNSHMKSHSNVYQYRCSDCTYATKYCHSLKLHLRKYTHKPAIVLNPDGTPNPIPVIDVYGTRRGPRQKKSQATDEQKRFCNGNGNTNGGGSIPFSPIPMPVSGALSPATIVPYFYSGASGPLSNGFPSGMDGLLRPGNIDKSPNGATLPPPPHINNNSNHSSNGTIGSNSTMESESVENEKHHSKSSAIKCNLCPYITEQRESFSKHMILHAAAENQDLCSLYGINSESLMLDPNQQQQISATAMSAMVAAFGLGNNTRGDVHRQSIPVSLASTPTGYDMIGHNVSYRSSPNTAPNNNNNYNKDKHGRIDGEGVHMNGIPPMPSSLDHLRLFSEQSNINMYNMAREFPVSHYTSPNLANYSLDASPNTTDKSSINSFSPGANSQKASSHNTKNSKEGAISTKNHSPLLSENNHVTASGLGPLDLSGTKNGSCASRASSNGSSPLNNLQQLSPRQHSPVSNTQQSQRVISNGDYENLQVNTDGISCSQQPDLVSPTNQTKHRRKGKAFKLDRICMKLQKDYSYSDSPSDEMAADDSMGEYDLRSRSSDPLTNDADDEFKIIEIKEEPADLPNESDSHQPIKEVEMNGSLVNGKKLLTSSKTPTNSLKNTVDLKRSSPKNKSANVIDLIDGDEDENELMEKNGDCWKEAYECQYCDMAFKDCIMYTVHMGYHGFKDPFKCNMCGHQTNDKVAFFLHIARTAHL